MNRRTALSLLGLGAASIAIGLKPLIAEASSAVWACWIGHSTVLLRLGSTWVLTDPVMFDAYGVNVLGMTLGPRRIVPPAITIDRIPRPDLVLLSHAHMDHMDRRTLTALADMYPGEIDVITATNTADVIRDLPWRALNEMDWGEHASLHGIELTALRVQHNGARMPGEPCRSAGYRRTGRSYNGYYINYDGRGLVFAGDTAYTTLFRDVKKPVHLAMMPIGAYGTCRDVHCTPEEALAMAEMMKAESVMPIHHSTFNQLEEPLTEPLERLRIVQSYSPELSVVATRQGQTFQV